MRGYDCLALTMVVEAVDRPELVPLRGVWRSLLGTGPSRAPEFHLSSSGLAVAERYMRTPVLRRLV